MRSNFGESAGFAPINGAALYYQIAGEGEALLLLHAGVGDSRMWDRQLEAFRETHTVICCDLRGFGRSAMVPGTFAHHDDVAALLAYLQVEQVAVVGMSFGGYVALNLALSYPEMVSALVLSAPAVGGYEFRSQEMLDFFVAEAELLEQGDLAGATELNLRMWVDGPSRQPDQVSQAVRQRVRQMQMDVFSQPEGAHGEEEDLDPPAMARLQEIEVPTLVMVGDMDVAEFQDISRLVAAGIRQAHHVTIPQVAHLPNMERPEAFNRIVSQFLAQA